MGVHWVGDLAIECEIEVESDVGELWLDLVRGRHHRCQIDVATGQAALAIDNGQTLFDGDTSPVEKLVGQTKVKGPGQYDIRFANVDQELILWVNNKVVSLKSGDQERPAHYSAADERPVWSPMDSGDLNPARIGGKGLKAGVGRLRVLRDIYYVAASSLEQRTGADYDLPTHISDLEQLFANPSKWSQSKLFESRRDVEFSLGEEQFFPMGDNSPASKDARLWGGTESTLFDEERQIEIDPFVTRERLIGKAFFVYWPHPWQFAAGAPRFCRM